MLRVPLAKKIKLSSYQSENILVPRREELSPNAVLQPVKIPEDYADYNELVRKIKTELLVEELKSRDEYVPSKKQSLSSDTDDFQRVANIAFATVMFGRIYKCLLNSCGFQTFSDSNFEKHVIKHEIWDELGDDNSFCCACDSRIDARSLIDEYHHLMEHHAWEAISPEEEDPVGEPVGLNGPSMTSDETKEHPDHSLVSKTPKSSVVDITSGGVVYKFVIKTEQNEEPRSQCYESDASEDERDTSFSDNDDSLSEDEEEKFERGKLFYAYSSALALFIFYLWVAIDCISGKLQTTYSVDNAFKTEPVEEARKH